MEFWRVPLDSDLVEVSRGIVNIIEDRCKGCGYCINFCPKKVLEASSKFNKKGYHPPHPVKPEECVNCHYCEIICPEFAIFSVEDPTGAKSKAPAKSDITPFFEESCPKCESTAAPISPRSGLAASAKGKQGQTAPK